MVGTSGDCRIALRKSVLAECPDFRARRYKANVKQRENSSCFCWVLQLPNASCSFSPFFFLLFFFFRSLLFPFFHQPFVSVSCLVLDQLLLFASIAKNARRVSFSFPLAALAMSCILSRRFFATTRILPSARGQSFGLCLNG